MKDHEERQTKVKTYPTARAENLDCFMDPFHWSNIIDLELEKFW